MHRGDFDRDISKVGEELRLQRMRCQLQIYTPPMAHCTSLKPEAASQWLHLCPSPHRLHRGPTRWFISAVFANGFSRQERDGGWRDLRMYMRWNSFWEKHTDFLWQKRTLSCSRLHSLHRCVSHHTRLPPFPEWESVMDVHVHNVSKNTSVTAAFTPSVLYVFRYCSACSYHNI